MLIGVLKGAVFFLADFMRALEIHCEVDFMAVASYGSSTKSSGVVRILKDLDAVIEGRHVLIVEDIVDSGLTLQYLLRNLAGRNPASLEVCALLRKPSSRQVDLKPRYVGFEIPDKFVVGYGLDHAERYRNLPFVAVLNDSSSTSSHGLTARLRGPIARTLGATLGLSLPESRLAPSAAATRSEDRNHESFLQERRVSHPDRGGACLLRLEVGRNEPTAIRRRPTARRFRTSRPATSRA